MKWHDRFAGDNPKDTDFYITLCSKDFTWNKNQGLPLEVYVTYYYDSWGWEDTSGRVVYYWQEID